MQWLLRAELRARRHLHEDLLAARQQHAEEVARADPEQTTASTAAPTKRAAMRSSVTYIYINCSRAARVTRFRGYAVSKSTGVNQTSPLDRHHPTETLETMRFGVSNVPGGLLGPEISQVGGRPSWPSGVPAEAASGWVAHHARTQQAHHACIGSSGYKTGP